MLSFFLLLLAGLFGGFLAGLLGVGGGIIFVFVLSVYFNQFTISADDIPRFLISNSIFATFFAGISSSYKNYKSQNFHFKEVLVCAIPGMISSLSLTFLITQYNWYSKKQFTLFFVLLLLFFLLRLILLKEPKEIEGDKQPNYLSVGLIGFFSGIVSALSGLGGGIVMIPLLTQVLKMPMRRAASISLGVIPFFALSISLYYGLCYAPSLAIPYSLGFLVFPAAIPLVLGVLIGAPFGLKLSKKLSSRLIKITFALLLAIVALKMIIGYYN